MLVALPLAYVDGLLHLLGTGCQVPYHLGWDNMRENILDHPI